MNNNELEFLEDDDPLPEDYILYYEGRVARAEGNYEKALELFSKSLELRRYHATHREIYRTLMLMGREEEAFEHIQQAYELGSRELQGATMYAKELYKRGKIGEAKFVLERILRQSKTFGPAQRLLNEINEKSPN
jgi:tetratricopeptide (TPR) repeat protein